MRSVLSVILLAIGLSATAVPTSLDQSVFQDSKRGYGF